MGLRKINVTEQLQDLQNRYAPVELHVDTSSLPALEVHALHKLVEAARVLDEIFLHQVWAGNAALRDRLEREGTPEQLRYFRLNQGPWSTLDNHAAFLDGVPARKPAGAAYYPEDLTQEEFQTWVETLAPQERTAAEGFFTVIRRTASGLQCVPYSDAYAEPLARCALLLREAAALTENESLWKFLTARADAFESNDYYASDVAWMDVDATLDITFGPYETYLDELFGYKAAFEAYIGIRDEGESAKVRFFGDHMQEVEDNLPLDAPYRNPKVAAQSPISVMNLVFSAGDGHQGVMAAAFNLPNDERVITEKGSKRVMMKNVQEAKFASVLAPIASVLLTERAARKIRFDSFFTHILAHEMSHGIGPHQISVEGRATTPRQELKDLYSAVEEAKADILGLFMIQLFNDRGYLAQNEEELYCTYLASSFRTLRFGLNEAHGQGMALQFNWLWDRGAIVLTPQGWDIEAGKFRDAVSSLAREVLVTEATGDAGRARELLDTMAVLRPEVAASLAKLTAIPVDIEVRFTV